MPRYEGTAYMSDYYVVEADDDEQAKEFIFDLANEEYPDMDTIVVRDIIEVK